MSALATTTAISINTTAAQAAEDDDRRLSSGSFGDMPTHLAEQVCPLAQLNPGILPPRLVLHRVILLLFQHVVVSLCLVASHVVYT